MRILHVTNTYLPFRNGVTVAVAGWVHALRERGHDVAVWTVGAEHAGDGVHISPSAGAIAHGFPFPLTTRPPADVASTQWDVVHTHHPVLLGPAAARLARRQRALLATTAHSDYLAYLDSYAEPVADLVRPVLRSRMRSFFGSCDVVFALSGGIERALGSWGVTDHVVRGTYPVDLAAFRPRSRDAARAELGIAPDVPLAVYAGRLAAEKHVPELLAEFVRVRERVPNARLAVAGEGPLEARVRKVASAMGESVIVTGPLPPDELGAWYCAADAFVSASSNEVGPLVAIEASLCGTPTVAYRVPGFEDRVIDGATGRLVDPVPGRLAEALAAVLADRETAHRMGAAAARHSVEHTPDEATKRLIGAYVGACEAAAQCVRPQVRTSIQAATE